MEIKIQIPDNCELVFWNSLALSFPTRKMAVDFFECFRGLCETAKTLL